MRHTKPDGAAPTRIRWRIVALLFTISVVTYIDRVNISVTARQMMPALGLTEVQMGQVFAAFFLGYALFQVPGGWFGDRFGPKRVLFAAILWWSLFTACTALVATAPAGMFGILGSLLAVRFLIGAGESMALPNFNRTVANWSAPSERGLAISLAIGGIGIGSAVTPPITAWIMMHFGWPMAFYASAALGLVVAGVWLVYAVDRPTQHPGVNAAEAALIMGERHVAGHTDTRRQHSLWAILKAPTTSWLCLSYTCLGYGANIFMSWFYLYLVNVRGFSDVDGAWLASVPFVAMAVSCPVGGWLTDYLTGLYGSHRGRGVVGASGMTLAGCAMLIGAGTDSSAIAMIFLSLSAGSLYFAMGAYWAATVDVSKRHAGMLSGLMNTGANMGGVAAATITPWIAGQIGWASALGVAASVTLVGAGMWIHISPDYASE